MLEGKIGRLIEAIKAKCPGLDAVEETATKSVAPSPSTSKNPSPSRPPPCARQPPLPKVPEEVPETQPPSKAVSPATADSVPPPQTTPLPEPAPAQPVPSTPSSSSPKKAPPTPGPSTRSSRKRQQEAEEADKAPEDLPTWAKDMEAYLMADVKGKDWRQAVDSLLELETACSFKSSTKSLKNTMRSQAVQHWHCGMVERLNARVEKAGAWE
ncbi:hypothetical protein K435DRAFT_868942 [Dendrothele bispora CBS 962.96]|uniref:Uncharacterized protein n=1 Tax=Dendrothele bispora (strain CBS 962.96) TaxID=1314807 RepID=A0A4S8LB64_DENBC|nr:hypothetical protein K435DRAFT_868942 [Dendrothele bispora CBS 962.96]